MTTSGTFDGEPESLLMLGVVIGRAVQVQKARWSMCALYHKGQSLSVIAGRQSKNAGRRRTHLARALACPAELQLERRPSAPRTPGA